MNKYIYLFIISIIFSNDSFNSEQKKIDWKINLIPLVGQINNEKYIKAGLLASCQAYSFYKFSDYSKNDQISKRLKTY